VTTKNRPNTYLPNGGLALYAAPRNNMQQTMSLMPAKSDDIVCSILISGAAFFKRKEDRHEQSCIKKS
jgi:hypothetical protein